MKPVNTKIVIESSKSYHDNIKKKATKFFSEVDTGRETNRDLVAEPSRTSNIMSSRQTFASHERPNTKTEADALG